MKHVMIDLETWGTDPGCAIRSIGAVFFDPTAGPQSELGRTFYANITDASNTEAGLTQDEATVKWWSEQSDEAKNALTKNQLQLKVVVSMFEEFWKRNGAKYAWSHGSNFDLPVWETACKAVGRDKPWHFRDVRDTRTLYEACHLNYNEVTRQGVHHNALDDAIYQARCVQTCMMKGINNA